MIAADHAAAMARHRSKSPMQRHMDDMSAVRQAQYQSRFGGVRYHRTSTGNVVQLSPSRGGPVPIPPPAPVIREVVRERVAVQSSQHGELFIAELTNEINEIKNRSRDFEALRDQYNYLKEQYKLAELDK